MPWAKSFWVLGIRVPLELIDFVPRFLFTVMKNTKLITNQRKINVVKSILNLNLSENIEKTEFELIDNTLQKKSYFSFCFPYFKRRRSSE